MVLLGGLLFLALAAVVALPPLVSGNWLRGYLAEELAAATGRSVEIGDVPRLRLVPDLELQLSDVQIGNAPGLPTPVMARVETLHLSAPLLPLLQGQLRLTRLELGGPEIYLEVGEDGLANWRFAEAANPAGARPAPEGEAAPENAAGLPFVEIAVDDMEIENGFVSYLDLGRGDSLTLERIGMTGRLPGLDRSVELTAEMSVHGETVGLALTLDSPAALLAGRPASGSLDLTAGLFGVQVLVSPDDGEDSTFQAEANLGLPSLPALADWLNRPLDPALADPGPIDLVARLTHLGGDWRIDEARLRSPVLTVTGKGDFAADGMPRSLSLEIIGDDVDLDPFLALARSYAAGTVPTQPPPSTSPPEPDAPSPAAQAEHEFDLALLRDLSVDLHYRVESLSGDGYRLGATGFDLTLRNSAAQATLGELALYDGRLVGELTLDATGDDAVIAADLAVDRVTLNQLLDLASDGQLQVAGQANGNADLATRGRSVEQLLANLTGFATFDVGGVEVKRAAEGSITELKLDLELPEDGGRPYLLGKLVYDQVPLWLDIEVDKLGPILAGEAFVASASLQSPLLNAGYDGEVHQQPVPSLNGRAALDIPSVGKLTDWAGITLKTDPGPLRLAAELSSDGTTGVVSQATLDGRWLTATATGGFDASGATPSFTLDLVTGPLDIDRYLPPEETPAVAPPRGRAAGPGGPVRRRSDDWDRPIDLAVLRRFDAAVTVRTEGLKARGIELGPAEIAVTMEKGRTLARLTRARLFDGDLSGAATLVVGDSGLQAEADLEIEALDAAKALSALAPDAGQAEGGLSLSLTARSAGSTVRDLAEALQVEARATLGGFAADALPAMQADTLVLEADVPGPGQPITFDLRGTAVIDGGAQAQPLSISGTLAPVSAFRTGRTFPLNLAIDLGELDAELAGKVGNLAGQSRVELDLRIAAAQLRNLEALTNTQLPDLEPASLAARLTNDGDVYRLGGLALQLGGSDLSGEFTADLGASPPRLTGNLGSRLLDLVALAEATRQAAPGAAPEPPPGTAQPEYIFPDTPLPFDVLHMIDAEIDLEVEELRLEERVTFAGVRTRLLVDDGRLTLGPMTGRLFEGDFDATATIDASGDEPAVRVDATLLRFDYGKVLILFQVTDGIAGLADAEVKLAGRGDSPRALAATLTGTTGIDAFEGTIDRQMLGIMALGAMDILGPMFGRENEIALTCMIDRADYTDGVARVRVQMIETDLFRVAGSGTVDLRDETLDLRYAPSSNRTGLMSLAVPFRVTGRLSDPQVDVDSAGSAMAAAKAATGVFNPLVTVGTLFAGSSLADDDPCETARKIARDEVPPPAAPETATPGSNLSEPGRDR